MGAINSGERIGAILCSLGTWFLSQTLHKKDSIFTYNNNNNNNNNNNTNNNNNNNNSVPYLPTE
jgi:hypothetical protein